MPWQFVVPRALLILSLWIQELQLFVFWRRKTDHFSCGRGVPECGRLGVANEEASWHAKTEPLLGVTVEVQTMQATAGTAAGAGGGKEDDLALTALSWSKATLVGECSL